LGYSNLIISKNDEIFFGSIVSGLIGYKENNGVATLKGLDTQNNLPTNDVRSLAIDLDGHLWIGTKEGLRVLYNASRMFENQEVQAREIVVEEGGNLGELLKNQFITDIKVNGNNQKWVATADSGVFKFSPDGTETLHHFTKENSPLPSNSIRNVTINNQDGKVYFGTANGMVSFQGNAFSARDNFDQVEVYPNPVRPEFKGRLTIRGLQEDSTIKITDISGHLVHETESQGGSIQWDLKNLQGNRVRTGVYLIFISDREGIETTVEKVMIVN
jgi:ligand-binding sensor domain-containing protein